MKYEFKLPDIGEGIHEAELVEWRVRVGDRVKDGDEVVTMNTDKVTVDLPSPRTGVIAALHGSPGEVITVGTVIMVIDPVDAPRALAAATQASVAPVALAASNGVQATSNGRANGQSARHDWNSTAAINAAPSTRRMARERGVSLTGLAGSGPGGRVLRADVEAAASNSAAAVVQQARAPSDAKLAGKKRLILSGARAVSAKNLHDSVQRTVTTTSTFEVMADGLKRLLAQLSPEAEKHGLKLSPLHLIAKCVAAALARHERFNATIDEETSELVLHASVDLGVAVAAADRLIVPVICGVERRLLLDVVKNIAEVSQRARDHKLAVADLKGGTFTLSSTGGLERANMISTRPIISPPQTAVLWASRISDRPRVVDGQLQAGPMMVCSLSFDHRYIDGAEATRFINDLADYLEHPERALA